MAKKSKEDNKTNPPPADKTAGKGFDAADKSLSEALRLSFIILKVIMVVLVVLFLVSGFKTVGSDEQALVLRFGKIRGEREDRILTPGLHWVFPYPIDEIVRIPVEKKVNLVVNSFWYYDNPLQKTRVAPTLDPIRDGYCITRSEKQTESVGGSSGSDYNILHCKWQLTYQVKDPEFKNPERFFKNVYVEDAKPGQIYFDVMKESITPLLKGLFEDAVVTAMVNYTIDEAMFEQVGKVTEHVKQLLQEKLDKIEGGIIIESVQVTDITWPRQVNEAFEALISASQDSQKSIDEARTYAQKTLNEAGGPVAEELLEALERDPALRESNGNFSEQETELLWKQLAGTAQEKIADARAYRTKVVETARANAEYLQQILPEYRKRPKLVLQEIYQDAIEEVLNNVDEKVIIQPTQGTKGNEIWMQLSRDPTIKSKSDKNK
jgi:membrane protease subunit HflK